MPASSIDQWFAIEIQLHVPDIQLIVYSHRSLVTIHSSSVVVFNDCCLWFVAFAWLDCFSFVLCFWALPIAFPLLILHILAGILEKFYPALGQARFLVGRWYSRIGYSTFQAVFPAARPLSPPDPCSTFPSTAHSASRWSFSETALSPSVHIHLQSSSILPWASIS